MSKVGEQKQQMKQAININKKPSYDIEEKSDRSLKEKIGRTQNFLETMAQVIWLTKLKLWVK